ncbi:hypothetical protein pb186bvf_005346 [Paramecium bursaria]
MLIGYQIQSYQYIFQQLYFKIKRLEWDKKKIQMMSQYSLEQTTVNLDETLTQQNRIKRKYK